MGEEKENKVTIKKYGFMNWYTFQLENNTFISYLTAIIVSIITSIITTVLFKETIL